MDTHAVCTSIEAAASMAEETRRRAVHRVYSAVNTGRPAANPVTKAEDAAATIQVAANQRTVTAVGPIVDAVATATEAEADVTEAVAVAVAQDRAGAEWHRTARAKGPT